MLEECFMATPFLYSLFIFCYFFFIHFAYASYTVRTVRLFLPLETVVYEMLYNMAKTKKKNKLPTQRKQKNKKERKSLATKNIKKRKKFHSLIHLKLYS